MLSLRFSSTHAIILKNFIRLDTHKRDLVGTARNVESRSAACEPPLVLRCSVYWLTTSVNLKLLVIGFAPPVVALTVTVELPAGVPGFELLLEVLPPHEPSHTVEKPNATIKASMRIAPRRDAFRDPATKIMPNNPGSKAA